MKERLQKLKDLCKNKNRENYLYSESFGKKGENYNIFYSSTVNDSNTLVFNEVIETILDDDNFKWFINELKIDGKTLYQINEEASIKRKNNNEKSWLTRQGANKYCGTTNRKHLNEMDDSSKERVGEYKLFENYKNKKHPVIGYSSKYQVPITRESSGKRAIDIVFTNDNTIYICELKKSESGEGILRCICEVLTYYYLIHEHIKADAPNNYFYKAILDDDYKEDIIYKIEPAIICPESFIKDINIKPLLEKLKIQCNIDLKIVTIKNDNGILDE